jgi:uncharacterized protein YbjT (DUF2867 family)
VFVTGGTGYIGTRVVARLLARGHAVRALARPGSVTRLPAGCVVVSGNALDGSTFASEVAGCDTFLQLVGTPKPSPAKAEQFRTVDLVSAMQSVRVAAAAGVAHFVYLSVAQPAPIMRAYVDVRAQGEAAIRGAGLTATFLRPWYVLGPGHYWPYALVPMYAILKRLRSTRETARRLDLITLSQMVAACVRAVEDPPRPGETRVWEVPQLRGEGRAPSAEQSARRGER